MGRRIAATAGLIGDPDMPILEIRARIATLEAQRRGVADRLHAARGRLQANTAAGDRALAVREFCATFAARLATLGQTPEGRRTVFGQVLDRVT
jgi:hypothetical protein